MSQNNFERELNGLLNDSILATLWSFMKEKSIRELIKDKEMYLIKELVEELRNLFVEKFLMSFIFEFLGYEPYIDARFLILDEYDGQYDRPMCPECCEDIDRKTWIPFQIKVLDKSIGSYSYLDGEIIHPNQFEEELCFDSEVYIRFGCNFLHNRWCEVILRPMDYIGCFNSESDLVLCTYSW